MQALRRAAPRASKSTTRRTPRASKPSKPSKPPQRPTARRTNLSDFKQRHQLLRNRIRAQRTARREDWTLGPLAPRRDAGEGKETYGTVGLRELQGAEGQKGKRKGEAKKDGELIWVGDRVVVVGEKGPEGRERGRIGTVTEVKREQGECVVEEMNLVNVRAPTYLQKMEPDQPIIRTLPLPIPLSSVRLVYPLTNSFTKTKADTIIHSITTVPGLPGRYISNSLAATGDWVRLPRMPGYGDERTKKREDEKDNDDDTLRYEVEERTWIPTLLRAPMPGGVIDELRGKYSRFRNRHEEGYIRAQEARAKRREEWRKWQESSEGMLMTPGKEARQREVQELKKKGKPTLGEETLQRIGEVMAKNHIALTASRERDVRERDALARFQAEKENMGKRVGEKELQQLEHGVANLQIRQGTEEESENMAAVWDVADGRAREAVARPRPGAGGKRVWKLEEDMDGNSTSTSTSTSV